jgi:hypothetical protein
MSTIPTRRSFFKIGTGGVIASVLGFDLRPAYAQSKELKIARTTLIGVRCAPRDRRCNRTL